AQALDEQGAALIAASAELEARIGAVRDDFAAGLRSVPPQKLLAPEETELVQRAPEDEAEAPAAPAPEPAVEETAAAEPAAPSDRYEGREQIDLTSGLPAWLSGVDPPTEAQRQARLEEVKRRRAEDLALIGEWSGGKFEDLNWAQKGLFALGLNFRRLWRRILRIGWPDWRKAGKFLVSLLDPRTALAGVVSGLSMTLSGVANLLSAEQWRLNPLQNLLKSAADIATGITIVLGSITALAGAIAAIMTAITILSFGFAAPVTGPIIAFCTSVMVTVGGWTIAVGKIALFLQFLVLIKNLYDAACAESADQLQAQSEQIGADAGNMLNVGLQIVGAKAAQVGGRVTQR
ncbi:MAG: hypothetical protein ACREIR_24530, partial [Geminicoccaceae bacterium]